MLYYYKAKVMRIIDGDTIDVEIDMGFNCYTRQRLRMLGYDTPERGEENFNEATEKLRSILEGGEVTVRTKKKDSFGRWLAECWVNEGIDVNQEMAEYCRSLGKG